MKRGTCACFIFAKMGSCYTGIVHRNLSRSWETEGGVLIHFPSVSLTAAATAQVWRAVHLLCPHFLHPLRWPHSIRQGTGELGNLKSDKPRASFQALAPIAATGWSNLNVFSFPSGCRNGEWSIQAERSCRQRDTGPKYRIKVELN